MAIIDVVWVPELDTGSQNQNETTVTHVYRVFTDNTEGGFTTIYEAMFADGIPSYGDEMAAGDEDTGGTGLYCNKIDPRRTTDPTAIDVYATFSTLGLSSTNDGKWAVDISSDGVISSENAFTDYSGNLILNSANEIYPDGVPTPLYDEEFSISYQTNNLTNPDPEQLAQLRGCINSTAVTFTVKGIERTFPPYTLKLVNATWKNIFQITNVGSTWAVFYVSLKLQYRHQLQKNTYSGDGDGEEIGWQTQIVDKGYCKKGTDGNPVPIHVSNRAVKSLQFLDGDGNPLDMTSGGGVIQAVFLPPVILAPGPADLNPLLDGIE